jgi:hypothetical protein
VWYLLVAIALTTATTADVTATRLDGTAVVGQIDSWSDDQLVLATVEGEQPIPVADLLSVRFSSSVPPTGSLPPVLIMVDGSIVPIHGFGVSSEAAVVTVENSPVAAAPQTLDVPLRAVRAIRLQPLSADVSEQWQEILNLTVPNDLLVVIKRGGKSLDYLEGVIGEVTEDTIEFTPDDTRIDVPRGKVAGLVFYRPKTAPPPPPCVLFGPNEFRLAARSVRLEGGHLHAATLAGVELKWPLVLVQSADFSAGKIVFLSDTQPVSQSWQPLIGLPIAATNLAALGRPRFDRSAVGGTLSLWYPGPPFAEAAGKLESFDKGIAIRSRTELVYRFPSGFSRFAAVAGIEPSMRDSGNVKLSLYGDEQPMLEAAVSGLDAPLSIELDIANVKRLRIVVDYGLNLDTGDWLNLCNARIMK